MGMRMVGLGLLACACALGTACSSSAKPEGSGGGSTTTPTTSSTGATTPGSTAKPPPGPDPCQAVTVEQINDIFGAGTSDPVRNTTEWGWCTWTLSGGAQLTLRYPGTGAKYSDKTANAVATLNQQRSTAGKTTNVPNVGDGAYFVVIDSSLVVAKGPDKLFTLHYEAGVPTDDAELVPRLSGVANAVLGTPTA